MMKKAACILLGAILILSPVFGFSMSHSFLVDYDAIEIASNSVLYLETDDDYNDDSITTGSGFVAFDKKTFVTNYHVIEGSVRIKAYDEDYREYGVGEILAVDKERDIAIISFKSPALLPPLTLAANPDLKRGQPVATIGYPQGLFNTFSTGIISAIIDFDNRREIQFTAPISHGSSGGALFNEKGEVIGITSSIIEDGQNINYAVDISHVIDLYRLNNPNYTPNKSLTTINPKPTPKPTEKPVLLPPGNLRASVSGKIVTLRWSDVVGATSYEVYCSSARNGVYEYIGGSIFSTYMDNRIKSGAIYSYKVYAINPQLGTSRASEIVEVTLRAPTPSPTPYATPSPKPTPKPTPSPTLAPISRLLPEEIAIYKTIKPGMKDPDVARLKERMYELGYFNNRTVNNNYTETTAEYVKEFQRANGLAADGIATPEMQALFFSKYAIPKPTPSSRPSPTPSSTPMLSKPANLKASISGTTVTLTWTPNKNATEYRVFRAISASSYYIPLGTVNSNKYIDTHTVRGDTYYYKIQSVSGTNASEKSSYLKVVMPKPTPTPYMEPKYPLDFGNDGYVGTSRDPYLNPKIVNISEKKTVDGFTLTYYCTDVYGEKLYFDNTSNYTSVYTYTNKIGPGRSTYPGKVSLDLYGSGIKRIYVAISKIHTTDGKTYEIPESQLDYYYWEVN